MTENPCCGKWRYMQVASFQTRLAGAVGVKAVLEHLVVLRPEDKNVIVKFCPECGFKFDIPLQEAEGIC
jgi:hypothetical protein